MSGGADAGRAVDIDPDQAGSRSLAARRYGCPSWPRPARRPARGGPARPLRGQGRRSALRARLGRRRTARPRRCRSASLLRLRGRGHQPPVIARTRRMLAELGEHPRRAGDIGEEEGDGRSARFAHKGPDCSSEAAAALPTSFLADEAAEHASRHQLPVVRGRADVVDRGDLGLERRDGRVRRSPRTGCRPSSAASAVRARIGVAATEPSARRVSATPRPRR